MRGSHAFAAYVDVCETGCAFVNEVTTTRRSATATCWGCSFTASTKLGDGIVVFLHDVTEGAADESELKAYADVVAHDLSAPLSGIAVLVTALEQRPGQPPSAEILQELRATTGRAREPDRRRARLRALGRAHARAGLAAGT